MGRRLRSATCSATSNSACSPPRPPSTGRWRSRTSTCLDGSSTRSKRSRRSNSSSACSRGTLFGRDLAFLDRDQALVVQTVRGGSAFGIYPFSRYRRLELSAGAFHYNERFSNSTLEQLSRDFQQQQFGTQVFRRGLFVPFGVNFIQETTVFRHSGRWQAIPSGSPTKSHPRSATRSTGRRSTSTPGTTYDLARPGCSRYAAEG